MAINTFGVIGAGQMGNGIAQVAATAGLNVIMSDIKIEFAEKGLANITRWWLVFPIFAGLGTITMLMVFIGEGVRNAMDPRKAISIKIPKRYRAPAPKAETEEQMA